MLALKLRSAGFVPAVVALAVLAAGCTFLRSRGGDAAATELPEDPSALVVVAELALQRGEYREATRAYRLAAERSADESLAEQAARVAFEHHQTRDMLASAERWLELNPTREEARRFAAFAALRLYRIEQAVEHFDSLLTTTYINPAAGFVALLPQLLEEGSRPAVTSVLQALVERHPDVAEGHFALAQAALRSENLALALSSAEKAVELSPYWSPAGLLLARVQLATGAPEAAVATAAAIAERDPSPGNRLEKAVLLLGSGRDEEARQELEAMLAEPDAAVGAERALALIDLQSGRTDAAAERFGRLLQDGRFVYESLYYLAGIAEDRGELDDATSLYSRVNAGDLAVPSQVRVARITLQQESIEAALRQLDEFAIARPEYAIEMVSARSSLLSSEGQDEDALAELDAGIERYPDAAELEFAKAFLLEGMDRVKEALEVMRNLVDARPGDPTAMNALGYTLVDRTRRHREGLELIQAALQQTPDSGAVLDSMGWALHRLGRNREALGYLERSLERIDDPEVYLHLGEVHWALDEHEEAISVWQRGLGRYPSDTDLAARLERARSN